ncbi:MAG: thiamine pyrophosphate-dependent enzyme, partial [Deltaproteobacteria bacterium]
FEYSTNEKVAMEVAAAAAHSGVRSRCVMKHVGVNVAADALMTLAYVGVKGGIVVLTADDPYMFSSQNEQDNRFYAKLSGLPMVEPSTVEEAKDMVGYAFEISEKLHEPVLFRTTTRINHSSAIVTLGEIKTPKTRGDFVKDPFNLVTVPAVSRKLHVKLLENIDKARELSENSPFNFTRGDGDWGIVCNGVSYNYASDAVRELDIVDRVRLLRLGFSHPMPEKTIKTFLKACEKVLPYTATARPDISDVPEVPQRPPNLCAGCSHRATYYAVKKAAEGLGTIFPTDIGCYTLGVLPPLSAADFLLCMGSSVGTGCGFSTATDKKIISFIGDSTFFHSGIPGLINAVFNNHDFTLVILDNSTTAMTGHQPHPGVDMGDFNLTGYGIISQEACTLYAQSLKKARGKPFYISDKCKNHRDCVNELACPAFYIEGEKVHINADLCTGCAVCAQICPEKAIVPVRSKEKAKSN